MIVTRQTYLQWAKLKFQQFCIGFLYALVKYLLDSTFVISNIWKYFHTDVNSINDCARFISFIIPLGRALNSASATDRADFSDWMSFLPSNFTKEISPNREAVSKNTYSLPPV